MALFFHRSKNANARSVLYSVQHAIMVIISDTNVTFARISIAPREPTLSLSTGQREGRGLLRARRAHATRRRALATHDRQVRVVTVKLKS